MAYPHDNLQKLLESSLACLHYEKRPEGGGGQRTTIGREIYERTRSSDVERASMHHINCSAHTKARSLECSSGSVVSILLLPLPTPLLLTMMCCMCLHLPAAPIFLGAPPAPPASHPAAVWNFPHAMICPRTPLID